MIPHVKQMPVVFASENTADATTEAWSSQTASDQRNPATRPVALDLFAGELETRAIERNREFYATVLERIRVASGEWTTRASLVRNHGIFAPVPPNGEQDGC